MAKLGEQLLQPSPGWCRIDDNDKKIIYGVGWVYGVAHSSCYNGTFAQCQNSISANSEVTLYIYSNKFRVLGLTYPSYSNKIQYTINDSQIGFFSASYPTTVYQAMLLDLQLNSYYNKIVLRMVDVVQLGYVLDAIDLMDGGRLLTEEEYLAGIKTYLIYDDGKYKTITNGDLLTEIDDYKNEFMRPDNLCISDVNIITTIIHKLSDKFNIITNIKR